MELYLIRHTKPLVDKGVCYGFTDLDVADSFEEESLEVRRELQALDGLDAVVYSSPLQRCLKLSQSLFNNIQLDARLQELNFGTWEMKEWDLIDRSVLDEWMNDFVNLACPNGESFMDLNKRVQAFMIELKARRHSKVALVCHGGVIRAILAQHENRALKDAFEINVVYGQVIKISLMDSLT